MVPFDFVLNILVCFMGILNLFPFYWLVTSSFKTSAGIFKMPPEWFPSTFHYKNYIDLFVGQPAFRWAFNSILVSVVTTALVVVCSSLAAYAISVSYTHLDVYKRQEEDDTMITVEFDGYGRKEFIKAFSCLEMLSEQ